SCTGKFFCTTVATVTGTAADLPDEPWDRPPERPGEGVALPALDASSDSPVELPLGLVSDQEENC
ncbi:MAG TPA: hypothetical protein VN966_01650, partial [Candidatus Bathyarchaeia archaeon]|nr:hypothetical protein [Candidatus Bathyarchaeia archaeon]